MTVSAKMDLSGWKAGLAKLNGPLKESLARSMAVAGGQVLRDEAKLLAPKDSGLLASKIYLAYKEGRSNEQQVVYSVSWNSDPLQGAPHGHLLEFGHWQVSGGKYGKGGVRTHWAAARPFLRPALDSAGDRAVSAMIQRGRQRLPELLAGQTDGD